MLWFPQRLGSMAYYSKRSKALSLNMITPFGIRKFICSKIKASALLISTWCLDQKHYETHCKPATSLDVTIFPPRCSPSDLPPLGESLRVKKWNADHVSRHFIVSNFSQTLDVEELLQMTLLEVGKGRRISPAINFTPWWTFISKNIIYHSAWMELVNGFWF